MSTTGKNLERIQQSLDAHKATCGAPVTAIAMNPFEIDRLGFEDFAGIPIIEDSKMGTGSLRLICEGSHPKAPAYSGTEKIAAPA